MKLAIQPTENPQKKTTGLEASEERRAVHGISHIYTTLIHFLEFKQNIWAHYVSFSSDSALFVDVNTQTCSVREDLSAFVCLVLSMFALIMFLFLSGCGPISSVAAAIRFITVFL